MLELKRCADRIRSRTDKKGKVLQGEFINLNFSPSTKKTTEYSFEFSFPFIDNSYFLTSAKLHFSRTESFY